MNTNHTIGFFLLLCLLCGAGCHNNANNAGSAPDSNAADTISNNNLLIIPGKRFGPVNASSSSADIIQFFGEKNVEKGLLNFYEGESLPGLLIFPGTDQQVEIALTTNDQPLFVRIYHEHAPWHTPEGVRVGMPLEDLQKANGKPFTFYGFEWDYGGLVTNWNGGQLSPHLIIALTPENPNLLIQPFKGEVNLSSDDPKVQDLNLRIGSIVMTFER